MDPVSLYINFVLHAVLGKLAEADGILQVYGDDVRRVARALAARFPFEPKPLHRGIMLVAGEFEFSPCGEGREFTSWSERAEVAQWFADPKSYINGPMSAARPTAKGFTMTTERAPLVLFHHSWARLQDFPALARLHPYMGEEGARQIAWSLTTQHEVITDPPTEWPERVPFTGQHDHELDRELTPAWIELRHRSAS